MKSMTGFGSGTATKDGITCTVEIKSVNARFLDLFIRSPKQMNPFESTIRGMIQDRITRGTVEVSVSILDAGERPKTFTINSVLRKQIQSCWYKKNSMMILKGTFTSCKFDFYRMGSTTRYTNCRRCSIRYCKEATTQALDALIAMRTAEGQHIKQDPIRSYRYT